MCCRYTFWSLCASDPDVDQCAAEDLEDCGPAGFGDRSARIGSPQPPPPPPDGGLLRLPRGPGRVEPPCSALEFAAAEHVGDSPVGRPDGVGDSLLCSGVRDGRASLRLPRPGSDTKKEAKTEADEDRAPTAGLPWLRRGINR